MDKLKYGAINNKKIVIFLIGLGLISIIFGSFFITIISKNDQSVVIEYMMSYLKNITLSNIDYVTNLKNSLISNLGFVLLIWTLGISIIGLPITIIFYFFKVFILGFSISSFILTYKIKGLIFASIYFFPEQLICLGIYLLLTLYAIKISKNLVYTYIKKKETNLNIKNKYIYILIICLIGMTICSLYETFVIPFLFQKFLFLLK